MRISAVKFYFSGKVSGPKTGYNKNCAQNPNVAISPNFLPLSPDLNSIQIQFLGVNCSKENFSLKSVPDLNCPYCGEKMITKEEIDALVEAQNGKTGKELASAIIRQRPYLRSMQKSILDTILTTINDNPDLELDEIVKILGAKSMPKLIKEQTEIIDEMKKRANELSKPAKDKAFKILDFAAEQIKKPQDGVRFKRKNFLRKMFDFKEEFYPKNAKTINEMMILTHKIPSSRTSKDAFFVKYSRRESKEIAKNLLLPSMATTEHIKPSAKKGKNNSENYLPLCSKCNGLRGKKSYDELFKEHPEIPKNLQRFVNRIYDMQQNFYFTEKRFYKNYLEDIINTIEKETNNKLKLKIPEPPVTPKTPEETISQVSEKYAEADVLDFLLGIEEELADLKETRRFLYQDKNFINIIEYQKVRKKIEELKAKLAEKVGLTRRLNAKKHLTADEDEIKNLQRRCGWMAKEIFEIKEKIETTSRELQREHTKIEMPYNIQNEIDEKTKELSILRNSSDFNSNKKEIRTLENEINKLKGKKKLLISMFENAEINERIKELEKLSKKKYKTLGKKSPSKKRGCNTAETTNIKEE